MLFHVRMDVHIRMTPILSMSTHCAIKVTPSVAIRPQ